MQDETAQKLRDMMQRTGHALTVEDFDDIRELDDLARKVADPADGVDSPLTSHVVFVRGVPVYPLTLAHLQFLDESRERLGDDDAAMAAVALWVATLPEIADELYNDANAGKAFRDWSRRCRWTEADMQTVMALRYARLFNQAAGSDGSDGGGSTSALIGMLCREYGETPRHWMHDASVDLIEALVADYTRTQQAQAQAYNRTRAGSKTPVAPLPTPKFEAMRRFRECAERLEAKWQSAA